MVVRAVLPRADVVTLGKPMGNGYPVVALVTRQELFDRLKASTRMRL